MADYDLVPFAWAGHNINAGTDYSAGFRPGVEWGLPTVRARQVARLGRWPLVASVERPGLEMNLIIVIEGSDKRTLRDQLMRWFDPEDEDPKILAAEDEDGTGPRYLSAICESCEPTVVQGVAHRDAFLIKLRVTGDVRWRETSATTDSWSITASGDTKVVANGGTDDAYPILTITPTDAKSGGSDDYTYKRFVRVRWRTDVAYANYPTDIGDDSFDTQTLVTATKMQADGDDLRVEVDGVEVSRWLDGINTATTKVWVNLDFQPKWEGTIESAIASGDTVTTITFNEDIGGLPDAGLVCVNSEVFSYTAKDEALRRVTGVTRAAKGTSAGDHSASDAAWWVQHEVYIKYGNAAVAAPTVDGDYEPAFELDHSTNTSWVYEEFGEDDGLRPGQWQRTRQWGDVTFYGGNQAAAADPWTELGMGFEAEKGKADIRLWNPCEITNADFTNGEVYASTVANFDGKILSSKNGCKWTTEYTIPVPGVASTWEAWSRDEAITSGMTFVCVELRNPYKSQTHRVEAADCTVTLNSSYTPAIAMGDEGGGYTLDCTIENTTTEDAIELDFIMALNDSLEVDTDGKTVRFSGDGSSQLQALALVGGPRRDWLRLAPGNNTLEFTDAGTAGVTIDLEWEERFY